MTDQSSTRAGFVAIIGAPNAGKSTFLNAVLGEKLAIVTSKVQTTRVNMKGILTQGGNQFVFVDTPGIYRPSNRLLDKSMVSAAWEAHENADVVLLVMDATKPFNTKVMDIIGRLKKGKPPVYLALNKVDVVGKKEGLLPLMQRAGEMDLFEGIFAISALKNNGIDAILNELGKHLPESPYLYDEEDITDMPMRLIAAETTREKAFKLLQDEIPYAIAVETVTYDVDETGQATIHQNILIDRESLKPIIVGKKGSMIKKIGEYAREDLQAFLGTKVNLFLKVKVKQNWAESQNFMREVGLEPTRE